ncbi:predicted protein [Coccidioides posadasii str. Silveira]|uniref:Predicted protein n=1 Tax=Coccidioides posadasii (strain RMSCC 757 / Silveira) TaxID=443226 RepID=E9D1X3_COCPS|nr:predicted protein [Coccidioides posadasii str. Silveira]
MILHPQIEAFPNLSSCGIFYPKDHISPGSSMASCSVSQGTKTPRNTCIMVFLIEALVFFRNLSPFGYSLLRHGVCPEASWSIAGDKTRKSSNDFDIDEDDACAEAKETTEPQLYSVLF